MSFGGTLVAIVAILAFTAMRIARYRAGLDDRPHRGRHGLADMLPPAREADLRRELDDLRKRIAVLERLATEDDRGRSIAAEIEALRGTRAGIDEPKT